MTQVQSSANLLLLLAVMLPPSALESLGLVTDERTVETPFGTVGPLALREPADGPGIWIQPYSGLPTRADPRAALLAARELGVQRVLGWDEAIALNPVIGRGQPVIVTDYIDFTRHQPQTFFESEGIGSIRQAPPICPQMTQALSRALPMAPGAVYLGVDGPRRETVAEARLFRTWGADVLGQNLVPEIGLAGELELCISGLTTVRDHAADRSHARSRGEVRSGLEVVVAALPELLALLAEPPACRCSHRRDNSPGGN